jgi:hypothetical protein
MVIDHDTCRSTRDAAYGEGDGDGAPSGVGAVDGTVAGADGVPAGDGMPLPSGDGVTNGVAAGVGVGVGRSVGRGVGGDVGPHGRTTVLPPRWSRQMTTGPQRRVVRVALATSARGITRPAQVR